MNQPQQATACDPQPQPRLSVILNSGNQLLNDLESVFIRLGQIRNRLLGSPNVGQPAHAAEAAAGAPTRIDVGEEPFDFSVIDQLENQVACLSEEIRKINLAICELERL